MRSLCQKHRTIQIGKATRGNHTHKITNYKFRLRTHFEERLSKWFIFAKLLQQNMRNEYTLVTSCGNMEAVVCDVVSPEDLLKFEKKYSTELAKGDLTKDTQFEYAWCLIRSKFPDDIKKGIVLLDDLVHKGTKDDQRDYLFYLAIGNYKLKEYERGLKCIRILLKNEPGNTQALDLEKLIVKAMRKDGLVGMAIVGGVGLGVAGLAALIGMAASKKL